jgi:hypothetical protein
MRKFILAALLTGFAPPASADFSQPLTLTGVDVGDSGVLYLRFAEQTPCGSYFAYVPQSAPYYESALAMAIAAYSSGKKVVVLIPTCQGTNPAEAKRLILGATFN